MALHRLALRVVIAMIILTTVLILCYVLVNRSSPVKLSTDKSSQYRPTTAQEKMHVKSNLLFESLHIDATTTDPSSYAGISFPPGHEVDIDEACDINSEKRVPDIVHFIWFYPKQTELMFLHLVSLISAIKFARPERIMFWHHYMPVGGYWKEFMFAIENSTSVLHMVQRQPPDQSLGKQIDKAEIQALVAKYQALDSHGGIYMDLDMILLRPLDPLMCYDFIITQFDHHTLTDGLILSAPKATMLQAWFLSLYHLESEDENDLPRLLNEVYKANPDLATIANCSLWDIDVFTSSTLSAEWWGDRYAVHVAVAGAAAREINHENIKHKNTAVAEVLRFAYYNHRKPFVHD